MENKPTYINAKIQNAERVDVYNKPNADSDIVNTLSKNDIFQVCTNRIYWSLTADQFYKVKDGLAEGYINTFYVKII